MMTFLGEFRSLLATTIGLAFKKLRETIEPKGIDRYPHQGMTRSDLL